MRTLREGASGPDVKRWQLFLIGQGFEPGVADGRFGPRTRTATGRFQEKHGLGADGVVGPRTIGTALLLGFAAVADTDPGTSGPNWPPPPGFPPLTGTAARQAVFGRFRYEPDPEPGNAEQIRILGDWQESNIVPVAVPQLSGVSGAPRSGAVRFHRLAAAQLTALWREWEQAGLLRCVLSWDGSFAPRFVRGSRTSLSNHAFGSAFDINCESNGLGICPALVGEKGSVRELVPIANQHGFYWGGHFKGRPDGMHFEVAVVKPGG